MKSLANDNGRSNKKLAILLWYPTLPSHLAWKTGQTGRFPVFYRTCTGLMHQYRKTDWWLHYLSACPLSLFNWSNYCSTIDITFFGIGVVKHVRLWYDEFVKFHKCFSTFFCRWGSRGSLPQRLKWIQILFVIFFNVYFLKSNLNAQYWVDTFCYDVGAYECQFAWHFSEWTNTNYVVCESIESFSLQGFP